MVFLYDSGELTPENNCVDILLCENPPKLLFWFRLWPLCLSLCKSLLNLPKALWGGRTGETYRTEQHSIYPAMIVKRRESRPTESMCSTHIRASCGFMDRFNYSMALCCRGNGMLLTFCFPEGEEVSQTPVPTH